MDAPARTDRLAVEDARWLVAHGRDLVDEVASWASSGEDSLRTGTRLRERGLPAERAALVLDAADARRRAVDDGVPGAARLLLTRAALEQASHPLVAGHRARRLADLDVVADLGCGIGGDARAIAAAGPTVVGVDRSEARLLLCRHNAEAVGADVHVVLGDALAAPVDPRLVAHADPDRRPGGRRARTLADHRPAVGALAASLARRPGGAVVLSPAVPLDDPDLPDGELEFVQVGPRLVEAVCWLGDRRTPGVLATATVVAGDGTARSRRREGPPPPVPTGEVGPWLLEPAPALVRARAHHDLALELGARRVSERRALLTAAEPPPASYDGWVTAWQVEAVLPGRPRDVGRWLRRAEPLPLSISLHGDQRPVEAWWQAARGQPRGPVGRRLLVVATEAGALAVLGRPPAQG